MAEGHEGDAADGCDPTSIGRGVVLAAVAVFILPLVTGLLGAHLADRRWGGMAADGQGWLQLAGLVGGLTVGVVLAKLIVALIRRWWMSADAGVE
jgi:hypothetical protein